MRFSRVDVCFLFHFWRRWQFVDVLPTTSRWFCERCRLYREVNR